MKCETCGNEFDESFKFCPECGSSISEMSAASGMEGVDVSLDGLKTVLGKEVQGSGFKVQGSEEGGSGDESLGEMRTVVQSSGFKVQSSLNSHDDLRTRYEILEEIGRGGFARVWRARDKKLDRFVAVKRLVEPVVKDASWEMTLERFRREALVIAGLNHRNIVGVYDVGVDAEGDYIVMELVEGGTLRTYLKEKGRLDEAEAVSLVKGIAQGLGYAHKKNLVHRDIKPANVLLLKEGDDLVPKIVDFGLARVGAESELSMTGYGMGSPWYMPPEQRRDAKGVNHTADIYALGKTLYELLTGEIPDNVDPELVSPGMAKVIFKCVKSNPEERYFSAEELVADLEQGRDRRFQRRAGVGAAAVNECPSCETENLEDAKFCERCGTGLTRVCPECGRENSIHQQFCVGCGTDVEGFIELGEVAGRMKRYVKEQKWGRVKKEHGLLPDRAKLRGNKAAELFKALDRKFQQADAMLEKRGELQEAISEYMAREDYESALAEIEESLEIDPHQPGLVRIRDEEIPGLMDARDRRNRETAWEEIFEKVRGLEHEGEYIHAIERLEAFAKAYARTEVEEYARKELRRLRTQGCKALLVNVDAALSENNPPQAESYLEVAERLDGGQPEVISRRDRIEALRQKLKNAVDEAKKLSQLNVILKQWPEFAPVEEKKEILRQKRAQRQSVMSTVLFWTMCLLLVIAGLGVRNIHRNRKVTRIMAVAEEAMEVQRWRTAILTLNDVFEMMPDHEDALALQTAALENGWVLVDLGMEMNWVGPGRFMMGSGPDIGRPNERPRRRVRISRGFLMGKTEVTQSQYERLMEHNSSHFKQRIFWLGPKKTKPDHPVERVSWNEAVEFCRRLTEREKRAGRLPFGYVYRLPTEAEWAFAARGGAKSKGFVYSGSNNLNDVAWHKRNSGNQTRPVGEKRPNELGLHDMSGNVSEWVHDWYQHGYQGLGTVDPVGPTKPLKAPGRVIRGGAWDSEVAKYRVRFRLGSSPEPRRKDIGFRVVLAPPL